jgi:hypothetical protein
MNNHNYLYIPETEANLHIKADHILSLSQTNIVYYICYHITCDGKYPFIQIMLNKVPFCKDLVEEEFVLPAIFITEDTNICTDVVSKITSNLNKLGCDGNKVDESNYMGIIVDNADNYYALVNISHIDINYLKLWRESPSWFALASEIINTRNICNIPIDICVTELFTYFLPDLGVLYKINESENYPLPDVVYSGSDYKKSDFNLIFGIPREKVCDSCDSFFFFYMSFTDAVKDGGWIKSGGDKEIDLNDSKITHNNAGTLLVENNYGRYISGGINRYAVFLENYGNYIEREVCLSLTDEDIETKFKNNDSIMIQYLNENMNIQPDILVKSYDSFYSLTSHKLNKGILGEKYDMQMKDKYMII